jgi:hypothetical protein
MPHVSWPVQLKVDIKSQSDPYYDIYLITKFQNFKGNLSSIIKITKFDTRVNSLIRSINLEWISGTDTVYKMEFEPYYKDIHRIFIPFEKKYRDHHDRDYESSLKLDSFGSSALSTI